MGRREGYVEDNRTLHSYSLKGKMFVHIPHREILRGNCWDLWIFTNEGFMHWESGQWGGPSWHATTSLLFPVPTVAPGNLLFQHHEHIFVDFITICLWDNTAQVLLCDSSFVQPPTLRVPPGQCRYQLWSWLCSCLLCRSPLGLFYSFIF